MNTPPVVLDVENLTVKYRVSRGKTVHAVSGVGFCIPRGETLGLVGESGCGKSSVARAVVQLPRPASGRVRFMGIDLTAAPPGRIRQLRPRFQMILQDSISSLNPRRKVGRSIGMPLRIAPGNAPDTAEEKRRVLEMMARVGLDPEAYDRLPGDLSGGQCQRVQIARALIGGPDLLICDEPVSSLDVSIQAQILNLLEDLREQFRLTMLFISHDLAVVKKVSDRVAVMYLGKFCETGPAEELYRRPLHPYTHALLSAVVEPGSGKALKKNGLRAVEAPSLFHPPPGCRFHTRCPQMRERCVETEPGLEEISVGRSVACHYPL